MAARADGRADVAHTDQTTARVVWYYYVGNLTQQEIADRFGLTRLRVNRIIGQARADGSVAINVRLKLADCVAIAAELAERYGLADAAVVPQMADPAEQRRVLGDEVARMALPLLHDGQGIGIGWGRTLRASLARLPRQALTRSWVVSLMGGLTRGSGINTFEVATQFAEAIEAECWYLAAPLYCPTEESRDELLSHGELAHVIGRAREVELAMVTCGDMTADSLIASMPMLGGQLDELRARGAVGDVLGCFLDAEGRPIAHALNRQVLALTPHELRRVRVSILASGGMGKVAILRAVLRAGYVNRVVTDIGCARALLDHGESG